MNDIQNSNLPKSGACDDLDKAAKDVVKLLLTKRWRVATAESCTGGLLSGAITGVSGSSKVFELGICAYSNRIKELILGVAHSDLEQFGAVSREVAEAMAVGVMEISRAQIGLSVTGLAGPSGGTPEKPIGTVWIGWSICGSSGAKLLSIAPDSTRDFIRQYAVLSSLTHAATLLGNVNKNCGI